MSSAVRYLAIVDPESKRWQLYQRELVLFWKRLNILPEVETLHWRDVILREGDIRDLLDFQSPALLRIESPARSFDVMRCLLHIGAKVAGESDPEFWLQVEEDYGRLFRPGLALLGWKHVLCRLKESLDHISALKTLTSPTQIAEMFDKQRTSERLSAADIPTPDMLPPAATTLELLDSLQESNFDPAYIKLIGGSSGSGIVVVHAPGADAFGVTTMTHHNGHFYNTRRLERIEGGELNRSLQFLLDEGACVQRGIRMAQIQGQNFDVRVVVIHGVAAFQVFRLSSGPVTNLHLGGRRGDFEYCRAQIPNRVWLDAMDDCVAAASLFDAAIVGVDLVFERGYYRHYLLELNPFGDFLPNWRNAQGQTVYEYEIHATAKQVGWID